MAVRDPANERQLLSFLTLPASDTSEQLSDMSSGLPATHITNSHISDDSYSYNKYGYTKLNQQAL